MGRTRPANLLAALVAVALLFSATTASAKIRRVAVVVGANIGDDDEKPLKYAERDAKRMANVLRELGGVAEDDLVLLLGPNADTFSLTLDATFKRLRETESETVLFVYYSGHADSTSMHLGGTNFTLSRLRAALESAPADVKVLVVDACRSGEMTRVKGGVPAEPFELDSARWDVGEGIAIITSAASGEDAQESDRIEGGFFTHHFVSGLLGAADSSSDGVVTLSEAYEYAYRETLRSTSRARAVQHPTYAFDIKGRRDLAITAPQRKLEGVGRLNLVAPGSYVVFDKSDEGSIVAEVRVDGGSEISLSEGRYFVRRRHRGNVYEVSADVVSKHRTTIEAGHMDRISTARVARKGGDDVDQSAAWSMVAGGGLSAEVLRDTANVPYALIGLQLDLSAVSLQLRGRYGRFVANSNFVATRNDIAGGDLTVLTLFDVGRFFVGGGLRGGADVVTQAFPASDETTRRAVVGRGSALVTVGWAITGWLSLYVEPAVDLYIAELETEDAASELGLRLAPTGAAALNIYF